MKCLGCALRSPKKRKPEIIKNSGTLTRESRSQEILELQEKANGKNKENADKEAKADATMENVTDTPTEENKTGKIA